MYILNESDQIYNFKKKHRYLLDIKTLQKFDVQKMYKVYDMWPQIARKQYEMDMESVDFDKISHIVFAGMGGSGAIGDVFSAILSKTNIHVEIVKGYLLPKTVDSDSLIVATSVSGNTNETLGVLSSGFNLKCKLVAFSDGGKMQRYCEKNDITHRSIPMNNSPRDTFPAFLFSILNILEPILPINKTEIIDSINKLEKQCKEISSDNINEANPAVSLARWITDIPLIYYPWGLQAAAVRFKNSLQENVKMHAITEDVIEACHNGIVSWDRQTTVKPILIRGQDDYIKTRERWNILKEFFEGKNIDFMEIHSKNGGILAKLINLIYLLDYSTIYRAVLSGIDPTPTDPIDFVKEKLDS